MNLSLKKAGTLLVAGLAFAACSTDSNDSPLTPPLALSVSDADQIALRVCKVMVDDLDGVGETVYFEDSNGESFDLVAGNGVTVPPVGACTDESVERDWKTEVFYVNRDADYSVTEMAETMSGGTVSLNAFSMLVPSSCYGDAPVMDGEDIVGYEATINTSLECFPEATEPYVMIFKNNFTPGEDETGIEGCTPGGWRNNYDGSASPNDWWENNPLDPNDLVVDVWGVTAEELEELGLEANLTLLEALNIDSGRNGLNFLKHATAALLNSLDPDVEYPYTETQVRADFATGFAALLDGDSANDIKDKFDEANNLGCPQ